MFLNREQDEGTILIVDDVTFNITQLHDAVQDLGTVIFATDGQRALELAKSHIPEVILLDIEMPGMDGYAVCHALRNNPVTADCAVIFVTAHDSSLHELPALESGGVDFLHKPLNFPVVRARVLTQLRLKRQSRLLTQARRDMSDLVHNLPAFVSYWDHQCRNRFSNDKSGHWFGVRADAMLGMPMLDVIGDSTYASVHSHIQAVLMGEATHFEQELIAKDGAIRFVQVALVCTDDGAGRSGFLMLLTDVTQRKYAELALFDEKERIRITLSSIGDAVIATDALGVITFLNPIAEEQTGWTNKFAVGQAIETVMHLRDMASGAVMQNPIRLALKEQRIVGMALNCALVAQDGREFAVEDSAAPIRNANGDIVGAIIVFHDVSEARAMAVKMTHLANHDALTDLPNRVLLHDRIEQALQHARRSANHAALMVVDVDQFKLINDAVGHRQGDALLRELSVRLCKALRASDTVSRQGGDEFVVLVPDLDSVEQLGEMAVKILALISQPFVLGGEKFNVSASLGISIYPDDAPDQETLLRHADSAMFRAKKMGRGNFQFFSSEFEERLLARHRLDREMRQGLEDGRFEVHYQPKVKVPEKQIVGVEALVRLRQVDGVLVSPAEFIPLAEETGLIIPIGDFVLRRACSDARIWHAKGFTGKVCVNISAVQFAQKDFSEIVQHVLIETRIQPRLLELEITEGVLMQDFDASRSTLDALAALGISLAIDDFGTGYSSLAYLKRFPVHVLKIDQSFVRDMLLDKSDSAIIAAIINLGRSLGIDLVAEGVETAEQAEALLIMGCDILQGYHYSRPIPFGAMTDFISRGSQFIF